MHTEFNKKTFVAGHRGMVGSAILRALLSKGYTNIVTRSHSELDLSSQADVKVFFEQERPEQVYLAAAKVGGIYANNTYPAQFIYENLMIEANVIHQACTHGVKKLLFLGSSCIYPKFASQPITEDALLTGKLESTNEPYAIAKIAGIKLCESYNRQYGVDYRSIMPTNLYGPGDNYHPENSHVIPGLIRRLHEAKMAKSEEVVVWGTGLATREFLYADDMANAAIFVMNLNQEVYRKNTEVISSHINVGYGSDISIADLSTQIAKVVGYKGKLVFDSTKLDGTPKKLMDSSKLFNLGWLPKVDLQEGLTLVYKDFLKGNC